ncbi:MAG: pyridoxamine 5'-phosphate oxidase family protein [Planctomycetes bacterium]|nr:pyridoxamine 5'-phosphate oxidase family protein [Planctomycetota bacterium]
MRSTWFRQQLTSTDELAGLIGVPSELSVKKQRCELDQHMQDFIAQSPFVLLGTVGRDARCDVSPRGDAPGVARVLDSRNLAIPDWSGNRRVDSLRNIIETGRAGLLFLIPGLGETLRVNGRACVTRDTELLSAMSVQGKQPKLAIGFEIEECFLQCAKALIRSRLWESAAEGHMSSLPCFAEILLEQTKIDGQTVESLSQAIAESYKNRLY